MQRRLIIRRKHVSAKDNISENKKAKLELSAFRFALFCMFYGFQVYIRMRNTMIITIIEPNQYNVHRLFLFLNGFFNVKYKSMNIKQFNVISIMLLMPSK